MAAKSGLKRLARIYQKKFDRNCKVKHIAHLFWIEDLDPVRYDLGKRTSRARMANIKTWPYPQDPCFLKRVKSRHHKDRRYEIV